MMPQRIRHAAFMTAAALAALISLQAPARAASTETVLYTYQGQALTYYERYGREGLEESRQVNLPGVAFNFYLEAPLKAGETISFQNPWDTSRTFYGVMGENGLFDTWYFSSWVNDYTQGQSNFRSSENAGNDGFSTVYPSPPTITINAGKPGTWTANAADLPTGLNYRTAYAIPWVNPVPEADASVMAVLGLAAVGTLARRKIKKQAPAHAA